ncbi:MAG: Zn-dependent alcohol dehydrogenase [Dongiaceae bacterium]
MKAAVCRAFGKPLTIEELDIADPGAYEVKVRLKACAICHSDIHFMEGAWGGDLPAVYGHEASGIVTEIGAGVVDLKVDDHVVVTLIRSCGHCIPCAEGRQVLCEAPFPRDQATALHTKDGGGVAQGLKTGAFAESVVVHASQVAAIPRDVPMDSAALIACGVLTGYGAVVNTAQVPAGSDVAIIGVGGVGLNSVQGAAISGARAILAIDLSDAKLAAAEEFGATHGINSGKEDARAAVLAATGGRGADYVFVTVGSTKAIEQAMGLMRRGGTLVVVGMPASGAMASFEPVNFAYHGQRLLGSNMGSSRIRIDVPRIVDLYKQGRLKLDQLITRRYALGEINEAVAAVNRGEALRNVILF